MALIRYGDIVDAEIADHNGIVKFRPALVLTPNADIDAGEPLVLAAITGSQIPEVLPSHLVGLPSTAVWPHPVTKLKKKSVVHLGWLSVVLQDAVKRRGMAPGKVMWEVREYFAAQESAQQADAISPQSGA